MPNPDLVLKALLVEHAVSLGTICRLAGSPKSLSGHALHLHPFQVVKPGLLSPFPVHSQLHVTGDKP